MNLNLFGAGRIGRHIIRHADSLNKFETIHVCEKNTNLDTLCYLLNYDSVYGLRQEIYEADAHGITNTETGLKIKVVHADNWAAYNWDTHFAIDATGVENMAEILATKFAHVYITCTPKVNIDEYLVANSSKQHIERSDSKLISTSICDTTAITPVLEILDETFGLNYGHITTLHPWLGYQNLLDADIRSTSVPSSYYSDLALGRKSTEALIPKTTSAVSALYLALPKFSGKLQSWSFRVPTPIVSTAIMNLNFASEPADNKQVISLLRNSPGITISKPNLISTDYIGLKRNCAVDIASLSVQDTSLYLTLWYDNELGYASQVLNMIVNNEEFK